MLGRNSVLIVMGIGAILLAIVAISNLFMSEFAKGEVYPPYSTYQPGPDGCRVVFDLCSELNKTPERNTTPLYRALKEKPDAILFLGMSAGAFEQYPDDVIDRLDDYVRAGGRVVIALDGQSWADKMTIPGEKFIPGTGDVRGSENEDENASDPDDSDDKESSDTKNAGKDKGKGKAAEKAGPDKETKGAKVDKDETKYASVEDKFQRELFVKAQARLKKKREKQGLPFLPLDFKPTLYGRWGVGVDFYDPNFGKHFSQDTDDNGEPKQIPEQADFDAYPEQLPSGVEHFMPWKSFAYFARLEKEWTVLYSVDRSRRPVAIDRMVGKGHVIFLSDSSFLTNEALSGTKPAGFLAWFLGPEKLLMFDETHLGNERSSTITSVMWDLRLEGYIAGGFLVFGLFVWRSMVPLQAIQSDAVTSVTMGLKDTVAGRDARSGLVNLLRRNVPEGKVLDACVKEWERSLSGGARSNRNLIQTVEETVRTAPVSNQKDVIDTYQRLVQLVGRPGSGRGMK